MFYLILGGTSGERAVSLENCKACAKALQKKGTKFQRLILRLKTSI